MYVCMYVYFYECMYACTVCMYTLMSGGPIGYWFDKGTMYVCMYLFIHIDLYDMCMYGNMYRTV